ncbi:type II secretion system F family protein [Deinococcus sp. Leaf326]|uniref:type II secretion system F family protein n=1 Tax=Deinococcus sp. Leaf326 TaxID=1736338 RepID=UPI000A6ABC3E
MLGTALARQSQIFEQVNASLVDTHVQKGTLAEWFDERGGQYEKHAVLQQKIQAQLTPPLLAVCFALVCFALMLTLCAPQLRLLLP